MSPLLWLLVTFLSGSIPFSVWIGRYGLGVDIQQLGDGNPGGTNVFLAGGKVWGITAVLLDAFKGAIPVSLAYWYWEFNGLPLILIAIAPILGHAFSPFLRFRGGKALAVTFGVWTGLTIWSIPLLLGVIFTILLKSGRSDKASVLLGMLLLLPALYLFYQPLIPVWVGNFLILLWTHRQ